MKNFLRKIKVLDSFEIDLPISKKEFVTKFSSNVSAGGTSLFSNYFEAFSKSKKEYVGQVNSNEFKIRKRRSFYEGNRGHIVASGIIREEGNGIKVSTEINGMTLSMGIIICATIVIYILLFGALMIGENIFSLTSIIILLLFAVVILSPIYYARRGVASMKNNLERAFHFIR